MKRSSAARPNFVGQAVGNIVNLLAPDVVVLGGGLVEAMPELYLDEVESAARKRAAAPYAKIFKIAAAKLGDDAAARWGSRLDRQPTHVNWRKHK